MYILGFWIREKHLFFIFLTIFYNIMYSLFLYRLYICLRVFIYILFYIHSVPYYTDRSCIRV
ncbi:hypothetical protein TSAR_006172 [Trichomalopsis sarcophagae]|uniref:Uncharacterized protein n=1 Tax=Trichomalopsis sarcophagae TaxID=543379 RepID=A0A232EZ55_9HYME|nr:hypothetical protein TSAR_006172 [Trichomalopsis sarcophagae]